MDKMFGSGKFDGLKDRFSKIADSVANTVKSPDKESPGSRRTSTSSNQQQQPAHAQLDALFNEFGGASGSGAAAGASNGTAVDSGDVSVPMGEDSLLLEGFLCPECHRSFPSPVALENHFESAHYSSSLAAQGTGPHIKCSQCGMKFGTEHEIKSHFDRHHSTTGSNDLQQTAAADRQAAEEIKKHLESLALSSNSSSQQKEEMNLLKNQIDSLQESKMVLVAETSRLRERVTFLERDNEKLSRENQVIEEEAKHVKQNLFKIKDKVEGLLKEKMDLERLLSSQKNSTDNIERLAKELESAKSSAAEEKSRFESEKRSLQDQIEAERISIEKLKLDNEGLNIRIQVYEEMKSLQKDSEKSSDKDQDSENLRQELEKYKLDAVSSKQLVESLKLTHGEEIARHERRESDLKQELAACQEKLSAAAKSEAKLESDLKSTQDLLTQKERKISETNETLAKVQTELSDLKEKLAASQSQVLTLEAQLKKSGEEKDFLNSQLKNLESEIESHQTSMEAALEKQKTSEAELKSTLIQTEQNLTQLRADKDSISKELDQLKAQQDSQSAALKEELDAKLKTLDEQFNRSQESEKSLMAELNAAKNKLEDLARLKSALEVERDDVSNQLTAYKTRLADSEKSAASFKTEWDKTKTALAQCQARQEIDSRTFRSSETAFKNQIAGLEKEILSLKQKIESERDDARTIREDNSRLTLLNVELEAGLEAAKSEISAIINRSSEAEIKAGQLAGEVLELKHRLEESTAALHELGRENQIMQIELGKSLSRRWANDDEITSCSDCAKMFSVTIRKHHCRQCGQIFCQECSSKSAQLPSFPKPVRVCEGCYGEIIKKGLLASINN